MILKNCELWWPKLDPKYPNAAWDKEKPVWEVQIITRSKEQKEEWVKAGLKVKLLEDDNGVYYRAILKRKAKKRDGTAATPVEVVDKKLREIDPRTIGNGSIGHIRFHPYDYTFNEKEGQSLSLDGVQIIKHIVYEHKGMMFDSFDAEEGDTEVIMAKQEEELPFDDDIPDFSMK